MSTNAPLTTATRIPLACVPGAIPPDERAAHFALLDRLFASALSRDPLANGYAYRFDASALEDVARFVGRERSCCPFLTFTIELAAPADTLWLRLTGPDGTREFLDAEGA